MSVVLDRNLEGGGAVAPAFETGFAWTVALTLLAFVPAAFLPRRPARSRPRPAIGRERGVRSPELDARLGRLRERPQSPRTS
jgi:hypothetical protein